MIEAKETFTLESNTGLLIESPPEEYLVDGMVMTEKSRYKDTPKFQAENEEGDQFESRDYEDCCD